jgi:hypothetical protein
VDKLSDWLEVAKRVDGRTAKQCRERWQNHLNPDLKMGPFTAAEDLLLETAVREVSSRCRPRDFCAIFKLCF